MIQETQDVTINVSTKVYIYSKRELALSSQLKRVENLAKTKDASAGRGEPANFWFSEKSGELKTKP